MPAIDLFLPRQAYPKWRADRARTTRNMREPIHPFAAALVLIALWIERARQRKALAGLDDHMLNDIGITRYDAAHETGKPFWR